MRAWPKYEKILSSVKLYIYENVNKLLPSVVSLSSQIYCKDYVLSPGDACETEKPSLQRQKHKALHVQSCDRVRPQHNQPSDHLQYRECLTSNILFAFPDVLNILYISHS